jgi:hypothetical protein
MTQQTGSCGNEHTHNNRRTAISMQWRGKHTSITIQELLANSVFCWGCTEAIQQRSQATWETELRESLEMAVEDNWEEMTVAAENWIKSSRVGSCQLTVNWQEFCMGGCHKRTWAWEAEEPPLLEYGARERLVKTQRAGKRLSWCCSDL